MMMIVNVELYLCLFGTEPISLAHKAPSKIPSHDLHVSDPIVHILGLYLCSMEG